MLCACVERSIARDCEWVSSYVLPVGSGPERGILGVFPSNERRQTTTATSQSSQLPVVRCRGVAKGCETSPAGTRINVKLWWVSLKTECHFLRLTLYGLT
jgi:hypothetical protein